ncbi:MAG TPA: substrate-binding domain-containing protein [Candidatus Aquilonibacter sp.]|nr:substrate-binding domain-containing protein [Candidatus Aquilonibacter sp.]
MRNSSSNNLYVIPVLSKALDVLELLQSEGHPHTLDEIYKQTGISKSTVYRILKTYAHRGYVAQTGTGAYRLVSRPRKMRFGFGSQSADMPFSVAVTESLKAAASSAGVDLAILDNKYDATTALQNAEEFVRERVDLVVEFQIDQQIAPVIADKISGAGIPMIAVDIPHPHATYFGVNNYRVGFEAGACLAQHAKETWGGKVSWVLGIDIEEAGPLVQSRIKGAFAGIRLQFPEMRDEAFVLVDGQGLRKRSYELTAEFLRNHKKDQGILVAAATDTSALGAVEAVREAKREKQVAIVGQDCIPEAIDEMRRRGTPLVGSVSHEAAHYGPRLIHLGLLILRGETVAPYNYIQHRLVTPASLKKSNAPATKPTLVAAAAARK